jgi:hypothetical protein
MLQTQPFEINDFSGGITDFYVNGPPNQGQRMDNLIILNNKSMVMRAGSEVDDTANDLLPAGNVKINEIINFNNSTHLMVNSAKKIYFRNPSAYTTLSGPTGNDALSVGTTASFISHTQWRGHLFITGDDFPNPIKIWKDGSTVKLAQAGLPALASSPTVTPFGAGAGSFVYAFLHKYTYTVGTEVFLDRGPTTLVQVTNSTIPGVNPTAITAIPVLANGGTGNYATAAIKIEIYRTQDGGDTFYYVGEVTNGTTTFNDNVADATIVNNELLYTTGGVLENDPPPLAKFVHIVNNTGYWGHIKDGGETLSSEIRQSIPGDPDSVPADNSVQIEEELVGLSSIQSIPIAMGERYIYRLEGSFDELGRGFINPVRISDTAGCVSNRSIVQAENMLFWAGRDNFYMTDGYKVLKIGEHLSETYRNLLSETSDHRRFVGTFDEKERRVIWAVTSDSGSLDNDSCFVLDLQWGISKESCFTTYSGGVNFRPTSLTFYNNYLHRADTRGYVFRHKDDLYTDPEVDILQDAADWSEATIIYDYKSIASSFGSTFVRKWVPKILLTAKNLSNISIQVNIISDEGKFIRPCQEIRYRRNFVWGDSDFMWGAESCVWNSEGLIEQWRWIPARGLRISYLQVQVTNSYTVVSNSDTIGQATINAVAKTATLDSFATMDWPSNSVDYYLSFESDNYVQQYQVTAATADTLTFVDSANTCPSGSVKWLLKGYKKGEVINLLSYCLHVATLTSTQTTFEAGDNGGNA